MNIVIISSSHRKKSNSIRVSDYLAKDLEKQNSLLKVSILNLATAGIPFWDDSMWSPESTPLKKIWAPYSKQLTEADGFIFVVPEWNGMAPAGLHNLFLFCSKGELRHKPALLAAVSTGIGGAYPISEVRMSGYKNTKVCYLPEHLIFRGVNDFLNEDKKNEARIISMKERTSQTLSLLLTYTRAFQEIRKNMVFDQKAFSNGM